MGRGGGSTIIYYIKHQFLNFEKEKIDKKRFSKWYNLQKWNENKYNEKRCKKGKKWDKKKKYCLKPDQGITRD